ncbi:MAG: DUF2779 domain-containing protein [Planctomycetes bacterium]|nr:DUF2779 domain-containing protein [Planctomycetota bacterium]
MSGNHADESDAPRIDKRLFEAGLQCAKRLYLTYHHRADEPELSEHRRELVEIGGRLVQLASEAFPKSLDLAADPIHLAAERTREFLARGTPGVVFHAAFVAAGVEVRVDILLVPTPGQLDLFEIKAGTTIKPRHLLDVALQIHAIESAGHTVHGATVLHLDPHYKHDGSASYPPQKLFKSVDVTARARRQLPRVQECLESFGAILGDEGTLELPTGTWCRNPLPCDFLARCVAEGPELPLVALPQLTPAQEARFHEQAIETIDQLDAEQKGLSTLQRRVVRAVERDDLVVEPFVPDELDDVDWPLAFLHVGWHLDVLPRLPGTRPWLKLPFAWSAVFVDGPDAAPRVESIVATTPDDPREQVLTPLAQRLKDVGTLIVFDRTFEERLRALLDDDAPAKPAVRALLQMPLLELGNLVWHGVYHPGFAGEFDLWTVHDHATAARVHAIGGPVPGWAERGEIEIADDVEAQSAYKRLLNRRTRATTRDKLGTQLTAWAKRSSAALYRLFCALRHREDAGAAADTDA